MVSRPLTRAQIIDQCESFLDDSANATWTAARLGLLLDDAITEVSEAVPYVVRDIYQVETRTGTATATVADYLDDTGESQFLSTDVGKMVYNTIDKTWATITSYSTTSRVGISKDIMASGEGYELYNENCWSRKQVNIENSSDYLWIIGAVYPVEPALWEPPLRNMRNVVEHSRDIIEIDVLSLDDTKQTDAYKDTHIYFARQHKLNPMTDLASAVNKTGGYSADATTMIIDMLQTTGTIFKDTLFYFTTIGAVTTDSRLIYRVTADATIASNATTISFYPGLECDVSNDDTIAFVGSTLTPELERIIVQIVAGEALMSEGINKINQIPKGGSTVSNKMYEVGERVAEKARFKLKGLVDVDLRANQVYSRG